MSFHPQKIKANPRVVAFYDGLSAAAAEAEPIKKTMTTNESSSSTVRVVKLGV